MTVGVGALGPSLHDHGAASTWRQEYMIHPHGLQQQVAVALDLPDRVILELHVEERVGAAWAGPGAQ